MSDAKKIAVLVRDRKNEALRMSVGLTLADDEVSLFVMDGKLEMTDDNELNIETLKDMGGKVFTNNAENPFEQMSTEDIAKAIAGFDIVLAY